MDLGYCVSIVLFCVILLTLIECVKGALHAAPGPCECVKGVLHAAPGPCECVKGALPTSPRAQTARDVLHCGYDQLRRGLLMLPLNTATLHSALLRRKCSYVWMRCVHTTMRACCVLEADQPALHQFSKAAFDAYFAWGENIDEPGVIRTIADECGLDGASLISGIAEQPVKNQLRSNTEEAIARGAYGSPTILIGDALYFGNDQLPLVRAALLSEGS